MNFMNLSTVLVSSTLSFLSIFSLTADIKAEGVYKFDNEVVMVMKDFSGSTLNNSSNVKFYASTKHQNLGYVMEINTHGQSMSAQMVQDIEANTMTILINQGGMKMGMQYSLDKIGDMAKMMGGMSSEKGQSNVESEAEIKKTGNTKKIKGYTCEEYEIISDKSYSTMWMAKDLKLPSFFDNFSKMKGMGQDFNTDMPSGFPMLITSWPNGKDSDKKTVIEVTDVNKDKALSISTEGYQIMKMN